MDSTTLCRIPGPWPCSPAVITQSWRGPSASHPSAQQLFARLPIPLDTIKELRYEAARNPSIDYPHRHHAYLILQKRTFPNGKSHIRLMDLGFDADDANDVLIHHADKLSEDVFFDYHMHIRWKECVLGVVDDEEYLWMWCDDFDWDGTDVELCVQKVDLLEPRLQAFADDSVDLQEPNLVRGVPRVPRCILRELHAAAEEAIAKLIADGQTRRTEEPNYDLEHVARVGVEIERLRDTIIDRLLRQRHGRIVESSL